MWVPNCIWQDMWQHKVVSYFTCIMKSIRWIRSQGGYIINWNCLRLLIKCHKSLATTPTQFYQDHFSLFITMSCFEKSIQLNLNGSPGHLIPYLHVPWELMLEYSCDGFVNSIYFNFVVIVSQLLINSREIFEQLHWAGRLLFSPPVPQQYSQLDN